MRSQLVLSSLLVLLTACSGGNDSTAPANTPVTAPSGPISAATLAQIDRYIGEQMALQHLPGVAVVVTRNGTPILEQGHGYADVAKGLPVSPDSVFEIGSVTKQFTATAIMLLVQDGKLKLDDPLSRYLPTAVPAWREITLRHLLTHTSGLARDFPDEMLAQLEGKPLPPIDTLVAMAGQAPLSTPTGTVSEYSNVGYHLLGFVVEKVSGQQFAEFLRQRVFAPLGMNTAAMISAPATPAVVQGYDWSGTGYTPASTIAMTPGLMEGEGGLRMSASDLAKWDAALLTENFLTKASLAQMHTPAVLKDGSTVPYGFAWVLGETDHHAYTSHNGALPGFRSQFLRHSADGLSVIVLTNAGHAVPEMMAARIAAMVNPELDWKIATDPRPQVGSLLRSVIDDALAGKLVVDQRFGPQLAAVLTPEVVANLQQMMADAGKVERFGYIDDVPLMGGISHRYLLRTQFAQTMVYVQVDADGRLTQFAYRAE